MKIKRTFYCFHPNPIYFFDRIYEPIETLHRISNQIHFNKVDVFRFWNMEIYLLYTVLSMYARSLVKYTFFF